MKPFEASFDTIVWRYYLMMLVVIVPFFLGVPLLSLLALPIFLISILGISFKKEVKENGQSNEAERRRLLPLEYDQVLNEAS